VVFISAMSEGPQLYSQIYNLTISNGTQNVTSLNAFFGLTVYFSAVLDDRNILKEEVKTYLMALSLAS
jgi:hypothetical protein